MRILLIALLLLSGSQLLAQTYKDVSSKVKSATVYTKGAQIIRKANVSLKAGKNYLKFTKLSENINPSNLQLSGNGTYTLISVKHQHNYLSKEDKQQDADREVWKQKLDLLNKQEVKERAKLRVVDRELEILLANKQLRGEQQNLSTQELMTAMNYFSSKMTEIEEKKIAINSRLEDIKEEKEKLIHQISLLKKGNDELVSEVLAVVDVPQALDWKVELTYTIDKAGWFPTYDIRVNKLNEPMQIVSKASVFQQSGYDWKDVKLSISSGNPSQNQVLPTMDTWYLDYTYSTFNSRNYGSQSYYSTPASSLGIHQVSGKIRDERGEPIAGATVLVKGSTIGTVTNREGYYSLQLPNNAAVLVVHYIGYENVEVPINQSVANVTLKEDINQLDEVVVVGYGTEVKKRLSGKVAGVNVSKAKKEEAPKPIPVTRTENPVSFNYEIKIPYTVPSDGQSYVIEMLKQEVPTEYAYSAVPKLEEGAFLMARVPDWENYDFLEGEASLYFDNNFVGKTVISSETVTDTLDISLGKDERIVVKREKVKELKEKAFIGATRKATRAWTISLKNARSETVEVNLKDQIPVSVNDEIEVELLSGDGAELDDKTGLLTWKIKLKPGQSKDFTFKYMVRYPKKENVLLE
ncbi:mucoidy inhibitor MuiA family protein [Limibacter armeniacum]|uniref:DUF4139 domain-containing protein n=1 Tax=Limibacter armeniacum TaxID=466084 RepID=UPI002FE609E5